VPISLVNVPKSLLNNDFSCFCFPISVKWMNAPVQFTKQASRDIIGAFDEQRRSFKPGAKAMTTLSHKTSTIFTALALVIGITAGFVYFAPSFANEQTRVSALNSETDVGSMSASQKVRCIMPPSWRRDCQE